MLEISKEFRFEAAHRLVKGYSGKCSNNHGHSWVVEIFLRLIGELNQFDFVEDFASLNPLRAWIDDNWDHATLFYAGDESYFKFLTEENQKRYSFQNNPTSEIIGTYLFDRASRLLNSDRVKVSKIIVHETCTSSAVITNE